MKAVIISNTKTGRVSRYTNFKSDSHAMNYHNHIELPDWCTYEVIDVPDDFNEAIHTQKC